MFCRNTKQSNDYMTAIFYFSKKDQNTPKEKGVIGNKLKLNAPIKKLIAIGT